MNDDRSIRLVPITDDNWRAAAAVRVAPDQLDLVSPYEPVALVILAKAYLRPGHLDWEPLAVVHGAVVVGVLALAHDATYTEVRHLAIDVTRQGQGVGRALMGSVVAHVAATRPRAEELVVAFHPDNERARRLYEGAGFAPSEHSRAGQVTFSRPLPHQPEPAPAAEVVTLCGSTRFAAEHLRVHRALSLQGHVVLMPALPVDDEPTRGASLATLQALHLRMIDLSNRVHVVNPEGYVGESTAREIAYAVAAGKPVTYEYGPA